MRDEIRVGDRVKMPHWKGSGIVVGLRETNMGREFAWVEWEEGHCTTLEPPNLTRIEPAVPQAKFRVGQGVRITGPTCKGQTGAIRKRGIAYLIIGQGNLVFWESELEAVPDCPTCGGTGKVRDA